MKYTLTLTALFLAFSTVIVSAQSPAAPTIPSNVTFAGINVQLDAGARAIVQTDVKALLANRKYWEAKLDRCLTYFSIIEGIMIDEDVPLDFKYLAVQESGLQPDVVSSSNAVGFWQFKKETATDYGLRVDDQIDERKNIVASTRAAAQYLKKSNVQFNNWVSSLYSFYLGAGGISKNIPAEWSYAREIKLDGKADRYILRFLAHKIAIEADIERYQSQNKVSLMVYPQASGRTLEGIAKEFMIDEGSLRTQNRWLTGSDIPNDKAYSVILPVNNDQFEATRERLSVFKKPNERDNFAQKDIGFPVLVRAQGYSSDLLLYEINGLPGIMAANADNVEVLSKKTRVSFSSFLRYNEMSERDQIIPGAVYYLAKKGKRAVIPFHTVSEGETLWKVSQIYGIRLKFLVKYNRLDNRNQRLQTGRILWLTKKRPRNQPVEVIESPQKEWMPGADKSQPRPATQEAATNKTPQKSSERKVYTPKMADVPPKTENAPATAEIEVEDATPVTKTTEKPANVKPNRRAPSFNPGDDNRVVIINDDEAETPKKKSTTKTPPKNTRQTSIETKQPVTNEKSKEVGIEVKPEKEPANVPTNTTQPIKLTVNTNKAITHLVEPKQTFFSISKMYDVTINDILFWNNLPQDAKLLIGQKLIIRPVGNTIEQQPQTKADEFIMHTVAQGETMFSISQKYGVKVPQIQEWNNLTDTGVKIGGQLKIKKQ